MTWLKVALPSSVVLLSACADAAELDALRADVAALRSEVESAIHLSDSLRGAHQFDDLWEGLDRFLILDPAADRGFQLLESAYGPLTFKVSEVRAVADGSRVTMRIGNLTGATIDGGKLSLQWGPRQGAGEDFDDWHAKLREGELSFTESLKPGAWNNVDLSLPGVSPSELGHLRLGILDLPSISLQLPN